MKTTELIYGLHAVSRVLNSRPQDVRVLHVQTGRKDQKIQQILMLAAKTGIVTQSTSSKLLDEKVGYGKRHQGVVVECQVQAASSAMSEHDLLAYVQASEKPVTLLFLDGVQDPHNLGACLRSANAFGVTALVIPKDRSVKLTDVARKVACGAAEVTPVVVVTNFHRAIASLQELGVWFVGLDGDAKESLSAIDLSGHRALVMGSEGQGMRKLTRQACDYLACIPMRGVVESLNVSVATGIALYEISV